MQPALSPAPAAALDRDPGALLYGCTIAARRDLAMSARVIDIAPATDGEAVGLPGWIYRDPEFFELEKELVFRQSWQIVCHVNDVPRSGDFHTFEFLGQAVVVIRGEDGQVRSFHNACRHRAARLVDGPKGRCGRRITCPYH